MTRTPRGLFEKSVGPSSVEWEIALAVQADRTRSAIRLRVHLEECERDYSVSRRVDMSAVTYRWEKMLARARCDYGAGLVGLMLAQRQVLKLAAGARTIEPDETGLCVTGDALRDLSRALSRDDPPGR